MLVACRDLFYFVIVFSKNSVIKKKTIFSLKPLTVHDINKNIRKLAKDHSHGIGHKSYGSTANQLHTLSLTLESSTIPVHGRRSVVQIIISQQVSLSLALLPLH